MLSRILRERTLGIAGDDQMGAMLDARVGQAHGRDALGTIARAPERHQQGRREGRQVAARVRHQVGGGDGIDPAIHDSRERRCETFADIGRRPRTREHHPAGARQQRVEKFGESMGLGGDQPLDLRPHFGLLQHFARGPHRTRGLDFLVAQTKHHRKLPTLAKAPSAARAAGRQALA